MTVIHESAQLLTKCEIEVLRLIACGLTRRQMAAQLGRAQRTICHHEENIYTKLHVTSRVQAMRYALRSGIVGIDEAWATVEQMQGLTPCN